LAASEAAEGVRDPGVTVMQKICLPYAPKTDQTATAQKLLEWIEERFEVNHRFNILYTLLTKRRYSSGKEGPKFKPSRTSEDA
jgi:hypothetical protein